MIQKVTANLTEYIVKNGGSSEQQEIYEYSISSFIGSVVTYAALILIAALLHLFPDVLIFLAFFLPLRYCIGGSHAQSQAMCFILSVGITSALLLLLPYLNQWVLLPAPLIGLVTVFAIAPVVNPNHPLSEGYVKKVRKVARGIIIVECVALAVVYLTAGYVYYNMGAIGMLTATVSALLAYLKQK